MQKPTRVLLRSLIVGAGLALFAPVAASAHVSVGVGIGIGVPGPAYYGDYRIKEGRCAKPHYAFKHPDLCGYPQYTDPVFIDGAWVTAPLYYRNYNGGRYFWWHGDWHEGHGDWDGHHFH